MDIVLEQPTHTPSTRVTARTQPQSDVDGGDTGPSLRVTTARARQHPRADHRHPRAAAAPSVAAAPLPPGTRR